MWKSREIGECSENEVLQRESSEIIEFTENREIIEVDGELGSESSQRTVGDQRLQEE